TIVEVLIPDFNGVKEHVRTVVESGPEVIAHNIETVERLTPKVRDRRAGYRQSLKVLEYVKQLNPSIVTKSSILLGMGETMDEIEEAMRDLLSAGVDILVLSQYLRPSPKHYPLVKVYKKQEWEELADKAKRLGFKAVVAGPLARTSYKAKEAYLEAVKGARAWS
ncbi:MAG: lipoyl synthase, partial [Desulfurococcales archaeon]|nr:lipoyl synthase [Desulfurococcales archaeon]